MKLIIKGTDVKAFDAKSSSQQLLQAGSCGGGGSETSLGRPKTTTPQPLIAPLKA